MFCPIRFIYTIQPGDSIYRIANTFYTSVHDILSMNPGLVPMNLYIGTEITVCPGSKFLEQYGHFFTPARPLPHPINPPITTLPAEIPNSPIMPFQMDEGKSQNDESIQYYRYN